MDLPGSLFLDDPVWSLFGVLCIVVLVWMEILLHEFGHWLMAKLCGYHAVAFSVGEGTCWLRRETNSSLWEFHLWPISGYIIALKLNGRETKLQRFLLSFGGPLFSGLCSAASYCGYRWLLGVRADGDALDLVLTQVLAITFVLSALSVIYNLWPRAGTGGGPSNDGWQLLQTLKSKAFPRPCSYEQMLQEGLHEHANESLTTYSPAAKALYLQYFRAFIAKRSKDILSILRQILTLPDLTHREMIAWRSQFLQAALQNPKDQEFLQAALEITHHELNQAEPNESLSAMMGAVQIELGDHMEGRTRLYPIERHAQSIGWKAFAIAYLAISDFRQGWKPQASERIRTAYQLCPGSAAVGRADQEIHGGFYGRLR